MRFSFLLVAALLIAACGESSSTTRTVAPSSTMAVEDIAAFVLGEPPAGYTAVLAEERDGDMRIAYNVDRGCGRGVSDWYATVEVTREPTFGGRPAGIEPHILGDGTVVEVYELWDDGRPYGLGSSWSLSDGRAVTVSFDEILSLDEFRSGIDSLVPVDAAEWARLTRALSIDTHVGGVDQEPDDVRVDTVAGAGDTLSVTFHRPGDFPLGDDDCRRACYSLELAGVGPAPMNCQTWPARTRLGDRRFISAQVAPIVRTIRIEPGPGANVDDPTPREATTIEVPGMPARFYAVEVPLDWCHHIVTTPDADFGSGLGEGRVVPSDPDRVNCDFDVEPVPYEPPEVCFEPEQDWVASTTTLREVECLDVPAAVTSTSTTTPDDGE